MTAFLNNIREYGIHIGVFVVIIFLTLKFLLPQLDSLFVTRDTLAKTSSRRVALQTKLDILEGLNRPETNQKLDTLNKALPNQKDIGTMVGSLQYTSGKANVNLGSFSIIVGSLATASGAVSKIGIPTIQFNLNIRGDIDDVSPFLRELNNIFPVLQVGTISFSGESAIITLSYFYKPQVSQVGAPDSPLPKTTVAQEDIFQKIKHRITPPVSVEPRSSRTDPFQ